MKLGMQVGLGRGHIVLMGTQLRLLQRGTAPNFGPMSIVATVVHLGYAELLSIHVSFFSHVGQPAALRRT